MQDGKKVHREESWHAKGHDYGANFTINFCAPVIEDLEDVVGIEKARWRNVSAYYRSDGKTYSIGQQSSSPIFRGRKLVLNYTDGSPCPSETSASVLRQRRLRDEDDFHNNTKDKQQSVRRKSTIMSFICDRDPLAPVATVYFVGTIDSCSYFFEVKTIAACGGVAPRTDGGLGPAGVFGVIAGIAVAVYLVGGCAYQRTVMHQRGWRQCPNYGLWAGIGDIIIIMLSSLYRCLPFSILKSPRGYSALSNSHSSHDGPGGRSGIVGAIGGRGVGMGRGRRSDVDEGNRLIDQLDEEWDD